MIEEKMMEESIESVIVESKDRFKMDENLGPVMLFEGKDGLYEVVLGVVSSPLAQKIIEKSDTKKKVIGADGTELGWFYIDKQHNFIWVMAWKAKNFVNHLCTSEKKDGFSLPSDSLAEEIVSNPAARHLLEERGITDFWQEKDPVTQNYIIRDVKMNKTHDFGSYQNSYGEYSAVVAVRKVSR